MGHLYLDTCPWNRSHQGQARDGAVWVQGVLCLDSQWQPLCWGRRFIWLVPFKITLKLQPLESELKTVLVVVWSYLSFRKAAIPWSMRTSPLFTPHGWMLSQSDMGKYPICANQDRDSGSLISKFYWAVNCRASIKLNLNGIFPQSTTH